MKRFILAIAAVAALACGCDKLSDRIDQIEDRVAALEQKCADLNTTITTVQKLVDAQAAGISIKDVKKVENGFQITFSDGSSYAIVNGAKGDVPQVTAVAVDGVYYWKVNGDWLVDSDRNMIPVTGATPQLKIEDEKWYVSIDGGATWDVLGIAGSTGVDVTVTEDDEAYYFDFGNDNIVTIAKMAVFVLKVEKDAVAVDANATETIAYTITGADETTHIVAEASGYTAKIDAAAKTVSITAGAQTEEGYVILKAIRNSDGAASSQFIAVNAKESGDDTKEAFTITISDITSNAFTYTVTPADPEMSYISMASSKAYIDEYGLDDDDALFQDDMDYFASLGAGYGMSLPQVLDILASQGIYSETVEQLKPETEYVVYAYGFTADAKRATKITRVLVKTEKAGQTSDGYAAYLGNWTLKGQSISNSGTTALDQTVTIIEDQSEKSYIIKGLQYDIKANYNNGGLAIPFGAANVINKFNFGDPLGIKYGCWMGYDGTYVYTGGSFYWAISEDGNSLLNTTIDSEGEPIEPIGLVGGIYDVNADDTVGDWLKYSFGSKYLFDSITRAAESSSVKADRHMGAAERLQQAKAVVAERCNCVERVIR